MELKQPLGWIGGRSEGSITHRINNCGWPLIVAGKKRDIDRSPYSNNLACVRGIGTIRVKNPCCDLCVLGKAASAIAGGAIKCGHRVAAFILAF